MNLYLLYKSCTIGKTSTTLVSYRNPVLHMCIASMVRIACLQLHNGLVVVQTSLLQVLAHIFLQVVHEFREITKTISFACIQLGSEGHSQRTQHHRAFHRILRTQFGANHTVLGSHIYALHCIAKGSWNNLGMDDKAINQITERHASLTTMAVWYRIFCMGVVLTMNMCTQGFQRRISQWIPLEGSSPVSLPPTWLLPASKGKE